MGKDGLSDDDKKLVCSVALAVIDGKEFENIIEHLDPKKKLIITVEATKKLLSF